MRFIDRPMLGLAFSLWMIVVPAAIGLGDEPIRAPAKDPAPIYVFVDGPNDLDAVKNRLYRPDFVILKGSLYDQLKKLERATTIVEPMRGVVESVALEGEIFGDLAHLTAEFGIALTGNEPAWVPIRLDGLVPREAREGDRVLPLKSVEGGWRVEVRGDGVHKVRVDVIASILPVRGSLDSRKLECTVPEAASTRLQLVLGPKVSDAAVLGGVPGREPLAIEPIEAGQRNRLTASLTPRRKVEVTWRVAAESSPSGPPLVTAQGDIVLDVERGSIRARSSWDVHVDRSPVQRLELRIDPADELLGLEWENKPVGEGEARDPTSGSMAFTLPEPLRPNSSGKLVVTTRRAIPDATTTRTTYRGVPLLGVTAQQGNLAIVQRGGDSWVSPTPGPGVHQVDPRDLPASLRNNASIILAYQFAEQPFEFGLQIDPAPPWVRVESRTTVTIEANRARVDTWLDYTVSQGRVFEVLVGVPEAITLDAPVGPDAVVSAWERLAQAPEGGNKAVVARLSRAASEEGTFSIHLSGWQAIAPAKPVNLAMFRPLAAQSRGGRIAVLAGRGTGVEIDASAASAGEFASAGLEPPADWAWPSRPASAAPVLWLRHDDPATVLPLLVTARERSISEETTVEARVERKRIDMSQETALRVRFGALTRVDVAIPPELEASWEIDGEEVSRREAMGVGPDGWPRYRLSLARESTDLVKLRFRGRIALEPPLAADTPRRLGIARIRVLDASSSPNRLLVGADESIDLAPEGPGWSAECDEVPSRRDSGFSARWSRVDSASKSPAEVLATAHGRASLPNLVVSRLAIRTSRDADGALRSSARFRVETHGGTFAVRLPEAAEWIRARVGREDAVDVDRLTGPAGSYRLKLPADASGPVVVALEYVVPASRAEAAWGPPRLLDGGIVQETLWEVLVPSQWAVVGVPGGWDDANRWKWKTYAFLREPNLDSEAIEAWISGPSSRRPADLDASRSGSHAYLFVRIGEIGAIRPLIVHRAWLLGIFSGLTLAVGLVLIFRRPRMRVLGVLVMMSVVAAAALVPANLVVLIAQSSALGAALAMFAAITQRLLDRGLPTSPIFAEPSGVGGSVPSISGRAISNEVGSDVSTIVRTRAGTTIDHAAASSATEGDRP